MQILFARHGQTVLNTEGRYQGVTDYPLSANGQQQAQRLAMCAANLPYFQTMAHVSSPLRRACQTMEIIRSSGTFTTPYATSPLLLERSYGDWEMWTKDEILVRAPDDFAKWTANAWDFRIPNGESVANIASRVKSWLASLTSDTFAVSHQSVGWSLLSLVADIQPSKAVSREIPHDSFMLFDSKVRTVALVPH